MGFTLKKRKSGGRAIPDGQGGLFYGAQQRPAQLFKAVGKFPPELKDYVGQDVEVDAYNIPVFIAKLERGPFCYSAHREVQVPLQLYVGEPILIQTSDGKEFDFEILNK